jgi:hypothetical protein
MVLSFGFPLLAVMDLVCADWLELSGAYLVLAANGLLLSVQLIILVLGRLVHRR